MTEQPSVTTADLARAITDLKEFIEAIDKRLPQVERAGEASIVRAATILRENALRRIAEIEQMMRS